MNWPVRESDRRIAWELYWAGPAVPSEGGARWLKTGEKWNGPFPDRLDEGAKAIANIRGEERCRALAAYLKNASYDDGRIDVIVAMTGVDRETALWHTQTTDASVRELVLKGWGKP